MLDVRFTEVLRILLLLTKILRTKKNDSVCVFLLAWVKFCAVVIKNLPVYSALYLGNAEKVREYAF